MTKRLDRVFLAAAAAAAREKRCGEAGALSRGRVFAPSLRRGGNQVESFGEEAGGGRA